MNKFDDKPALQKRWVLEAQWSDCPIEIEEIVGELWSVAGLRNDNNVYITTIEGLLEEEYRIDESSRKMLVDYLRETGVQDGETVYIYYWW